MSGLVFFMFAIFKVNEHFQGLKTTLVSLYVLPSLICQRSLHLPNSSPAERDVASLTPEIPSRKPLEHGANNAKAVVQSLHGPFT